MKRACLKQGIHFIIIILIETCALAKCDTKTKNNMVNEHSRNLDIHTAVHSFVESAKNLENFVSFEFDSLKLQKNYLTRFQSDLIFANITRACEIQMNTFINGLKQEDNWAITG